MIFRSTRGKALTYFRDFDSAGLPDYAGRLDDVARTVYVVIFQDGSHVRDRLQKICDSFNGQTVEIPSHMDAADLTKRTQELHRRIEDASHLIDTTRRRLREYLREMQKVSQNPAIERVSLIEIYKMFLHKERALYNTLNRLKKGDKLFTGYCWIPKSEVLNVLRALDEIKESNRNVHIPNFMLVSNHSVKPPSFFRINEFTFAF